MGYADDDLVEIGGLRNRPETGTDIDVRGHTYFHFHPSLGGVFAENNNKKLPRTVASEVDPSSGIDRTSSTTNTATARGLAEGLLMRVTAQTQLLLVLDPTDLVAVKPDSKEGGHRGTILCSAPLRSIIAAATDGEWLHVAVRQMEDVGVLIKNGNMALRLDSAGTCLIVKQYLDRCRTNLRTKLMYNIETLLEKCTENPFPLYRHREVDNITMPASPEPLMLPDDATTAVETESHDTRRPPSPTRSVASDASTYEDIDLDDKRSIQGEMIRRLKQQSIGATSPNATLNLTSFDHVLLLSDRK